MVAPSLPVYFVYWTALQAPDGGIAFRDDVYGRDAALINAMSAAAPKPAQTTAPAQAAQLKPSPAAAPAR